MTPARDEHAIDTLPRLEALLGPLSDASVHKELPYVHPAYRAMIAASPFAVLATTGPGGLDASPRGDPAGFVQLLDDKTLLLPERRGNNRADSLRNIVADPRVALLFLIPGVGETRAKSCFPARKFSNDDLPTLDRPMKANSGSDSSGHESKSGALQ